MGPALFLTIAICKFYFSVIVKKEVRLPRTEKAVKRPCKQPNGVFPVSFFGSQKVFLQDGNKKQTTWKKTKLKNSRRRQLEEDQIGVCKTSAGRSVGTSHKTLSILSNDYLVPYQVLVCSLLSWSLRLFS